MKKLLLPFALVLAGCPVGERLSAGEWKSIYIDSDNVCFTVKREGVLNRYSLAVNGKDYKRLIGEEGVSLTYPKTCFTVHLDKGVMYAASYTLNNKNYAYSFIIDNDGRVIDLGR